MINFTKNNLDQAASPYLQQHQRNPINWQEWSKEALEYAAKNNKIMFVSVGYATCHWCHVMAGEAFSSQEVAEYLNNFFISIKVDKEQRPDIDNYLMSYHQETQGQGGWPLNVFLSPEAKPFLAVTYVPITERYGLPGFLKLLRQVKKIHDQQGEKIPTYHLPIYAPEDIEQQDLIPVIKNNFTGAGLGVGPQFPHHNTLLFLLSYYENSKDTEIRDIIELILEMMANRGLHDHLQGGFYRYCIDSSWTIPHFEKMLYDQALLLWVYSVAYKVLKKPQYKTIVEKIIACLEDTYVNDLYYAAQDADTDHQEGSTYVWTAEELQQYLSLEEYQLFKEVYFTEQNFEGKIHLIKKKNFFLPEIEQKLLRFRKKRAQPLTDKKYITSWNALVGIGLIMAYRHCNNSLAKIKAELLFKNILNKHYLQERLYHSSYEGNLQSGEFLEDYATMLLFASYLYEETGEYKNLIEIWYGKLAEFNDQYWIENKINDFTSVPAQTLDHPTPSSTSVAEMAKLRASIILGKEYAPAKYKQPLVHDFYNLMVFMNNWHIIHAPHNIKWKHLPANSMQIKDIKIQDCYRQKCLEFKDITQLLASLAAAKSSYTKKN